MSKLNVSWQNMSRGGGLVSNGFEDKEGVVHWFTISRTRVGERKFYLKHLWSNGAKMGTTKVTSIEMNVSAAIVSKSATSYISKLMKKYNAKRVSY